MAVFKFQNDNSKQSRPTTDQLPPPVSGRRFFHTIVIYYITFSLVGHKKDFLKVRVFPSRSTFRLK